MSPGELTLQLEQSIVPLSVSHIEGCPDLGPACSSAVPPTPYYHHVDELVSETAVDASLAITPWFGLDTRWSVRIVDVSPSYSELDGAPKSVPDDIHHHDETIGGVTDPWLLARFAAVTGSFVSVGRLGLSLPLGKTVEDPYRLSRRGLWHEHVQVGTGTVVPIVGLSLAYTVAPVTIGLGGTGFFSMFESSKGYRAPPRFYFDHRVSVTLLDGVLTPFAQAILAHEGEEYWHGDVGEEGSNIRTEIYVGGGLGWRFYDRWSLEGSASGRVASLTDAPTFKSAGTFSLALSTSFDLWGSGAGSATGASERAIAPRIVERRHDGIVEFEKQ
jgi:hypothetical protein